MNSNDKHFKYLRIYNLEYLYSIICSLSSGPNISERNIYPNIQPLKNFPEHRSPHKYLWRLKGRNLDWSPRPASTETWFAYSLRKPSKSLPASRKTEKQGENNTRNPCDCWTRECCGHTECGRGDEIHTRAWSDLMMVPCTVIKLWHLLETLQISFRSLWNPFLFNKALFAAQSVSCGVEHTTDQ